ncbi:MAG: CDP-alcohol phosphatidyltransferase family protein [Verrucomicrobia bacterium]|nr:CDP-alcohol phosphatidyltransferase family protein [Verrucomicrobiota bacterium]
MMTTANKITIARVLLVPIFASVLFEYSRTGAEWQRQLALSCFAIAAITDAVDGYIARRYNQRSKLGSVLDPMADKLLLVMGLALLTALQHPHLAPLPTWLLLTVLSRDVLLLIGLAVIHFTCGHVRVKPHFLGKIATVCQMCCIFWVLLQWNPAWIRPWSLAAALTTGASGVLYIIDGIRQLGASPSSGPDHPTKS